MSKALPARLYLHAQVALQRRSISQQPATDTPLFQAMCEQQNPNPTPELVGMRVTRLPRNGTRPGQFTSAWLYGKQRAAEHLLDEPRTQMRGLSGRRYGRS